MIEHYKTVSKESVTLYEEKKSKFIATVKPVSSEEEAQKFIKEIKSKYWDATHNVYAYNILGQSSIQKFSDDGEPSGTAGLPVMEVIKRQELINVIVVVTRYFGGTKLGAAGLVRAYGKSASLGLEQSGIVKKTLCVKACINIEYNLLGKVQNTLLERGYTTEDAIYTESVSIIAAVPVPEFDRFKEEIFEITNGNVTISEEGKLYKDFPV